MQTDGGAATLLTLALLAIVLASLVDHLSSSRAPELLSTGALNFWAQLLRFGLWSFKFHGNVITRKSQRRIHVSDRRSNAYQLQGDFSKAIDHHAQHLAIAKEVGDRAGEGAAYVKLGTCHMHLNEYVKAVASCPK